MKDGLEIILLHVQGMSKIEYYGDFYIKFKSIKRSDCYKM